MSLYRILPDRLNYKVMTITSDEVFSKLGRGVPFHIDTRPKEYAAIWKPIKVDLFDSAENGVSTNYPDITVNPGRLLLNERGYEALIALIENDGEILPVDTEAGDGVIFNPLKVAENMDATNNTLCLKDQWGNLTSLGFYEDKLVETNIFRCVFDGYIGVFCTQAFKEGVEEAGLTGITFTSDLGNIFPEGPSSMAPSKH